MTITPCPGCGVESSEDYDGSGRCWSCYSAGIGAPGEPFALALDEFLAAEADVPPALVGAQEEILVPYAGLTILYAKGGRGKTTLTIEAAFAFASGVPWLAFPVSRPLRVLLIENEGPREPFRKKLAARRDTWTHEIRGALFVHTENWGGLRLPEAVQRLREFIEQERIDLVIGDPLDSLGACGVGSPQDTRDFVDLLKAVGLFRDTAFWLLHHGRKQEASDELDEISGAWGGRPDTMLKLDRLNGNRARLSFPKLRWSRRGSRPPLILSFDPEAETFSLIGEEADERDYATKIEKLLALNPQRWLTAREIAAPADKGGIGANLDTVRRTLESAPDRFQQRTGEAAKLLGRRPSATVWQVTRLPESLESPGDFPGAAGESDSVTQPYRSHRVQVSTPPAPPDPTQKPESPESLPRPPAVGASGETAPVRVRARLP